MINSQFKVVIVDNEPEARFLLKSLLSEISNVSVVGEADNAEFALYKIVEHYPNLVLMEVLGAIKEDTKIRINSRHSYILIKPSEIVYCIAEDGYTIIHLKSGKTELSNTSLIHIESRVDNHSFYRLGRSVIVNFDYVKSINKGTDSVLLECNSNKWEVFSSHRSIKELLEGSYNYA